MNERRPGNEPSGPASSGCEDLQPQKQLLEEYVLTIADTAELGTPRRPGLFSAAVRTHAYLTLARINAAAAHHRPSRRCLSLVIARR